LEERTLKVFEDFLGKLWFINKLRLIIRKTRGKLKCQIC
jgi:hypothetical protein